MAYRVSRPANLGHAIRRTLASGILLAGAATMWSGCATEPTEIVAGMTTQLQVPKHLKSVGVVVQLGGRLVFCESYRVHDGTVTLPSTLGTVPESEDELTAEPVTVHVLGFRTEQPEFAVDCVANTPDTGDDGVMVVRRRRLPYVEDRIVYLPMPLRESCAEVDTCSDQETCIGGVCEPMDIDPATLVDYQDALVFGNTNTCFDVDYCLYEGLAPVALQDADTCTFRVLWPDTAPTPEPGSLNVQVIYKSYGTEVLDLDDKEGFILPDPDHPLTFQLAPNLCSSNYQAGKIINVVASALCPAKRPLQPICEQDLADIQAGQGPTQLGSGQCTHNRVLRQKPSALYVLMDSSQAMAEFFGPAGFQFAIDLPLANPIAARTELAFSFLPGGQSDCSVSSFATPTIGFADVESVRESIGSAVGDKSNLQSGNPELYIDGAMAGAYQALGAFDPAAHNRRAVLLLGNRDFVGQCSGSPEAPASQAAQQFAQNTIHTYAMVLELPGGTPATGLPGSDAASIAMSGGTSVFDATGDGTVALSGVQEIINDLGSCLYDAPNPMPSEMTEAGLSYLHPVTQIRTDIPFDAGCNDTNPDSASGWSSTPAGIRICGSDCQALRDVLTEVALFYGSQGETAPSVPVLMQVPCQQLVAPPDHR